MSLTNANNKPGTSGTKTKPTKGIATRNNLNIRNLPTRATGFPESLFTKYSVEIVITGPNQMTQRLRALDDEGNPGKYVQLEDALRLCRAAGFVKACDKEVTRSEDTEKTRMLFHQADFDAKKVQDPKAFTKTILTYEENLNKSRAALDRAGDSNEDTNAKAFLSFQLDTAKSVLDKFISRRSEGKKCTIREIALEMEMPASMVSKTLTGSVEVPANGRLWTSLIGRELDKFCNLTLKEITAFKDPILRSYLKPEDIARYRALCTKSAKQAAFGTTKELSEKQIEKYLEQPVPIIPFVGTLAMLKRAEATKASIRKRQTANALFPKIIESVNATLDKYYVCPPSAMEKVRDYWASLAGGQMQEPDIVSSSYRAQTIETLELNGKGNTVPLKLERIEWTNYKWKGMPLHAYTQKMTGDHIRLTAMEEYNPPEIVGFPKKLKRKEQQRVNAVRKNDLTQKSRQYLKALAGAGVPPDTVKSVKDFLGSFLYLDMQDLAGQIVYMTCRLTLEQAKSVVLHEEEPNEYSTASEEESDDDDGADLPAPIEPPAKGKPEIVE